MKRILFVICISIASISICLAQDTDRVKDESEIRAVMQAQQDAWSAQDLEGFMEGYWKNDSLKFFGSSGITYGWKNTLENYKKRYPTKAHTGTLKFKLRDISPIGERAYFVMGEYYLTREAGDANGVFMIIFKRIGGQWKIVADMSC